MHFTYNETIASKVELGKIQWFEVGSCHHWRKGLHANLVFYYDFQVLRSMQITQLASKLNMRSIPTNRPFTKEPEQERKPCLPPEF